MKNTILKTTRKFLRTSGLLMLIAGTMVACQDDSTPTPNSSDKNKVAFEATDAPIDNAEVYGAFVTVSEIWVDGNKVDGYNATTFELSALTNGKTEMMDEFEMDASSMSEVVFKLDYDRDADGNTPGCYILKADGTKDQIMSTSNEITLTKNVDFESNSTTNVVFDFDLRKMVRQESSGDYELVASNSLNSSVRAVAKSNSGTVNGNVDDKNGNFEDKTMVYLYKKGEYNANEMNGDGNTTIQFSNAVNSAVVSNNGDFVLSYIEAEGEYEMYLFTYSDDNNDGEFEISGMTQLLIDGNSSFSGSELSGQANLNLTFSLETILPI